MVVQSSKFYMFLPLELTMRPSRIYAGVLLLGGALSLLGVWQASLPGWLKLGAALVLFFGLAVLSRPSPLRGLRIRQSGQLEILLDQWREADAAGRAVVLPWLVSLQLVLRDGRRQTLTLWPDSTDRDQARRLRVWLRWGLRQPVAS